MLPEFFLHLNELHFKLCIYYNLMVTSFYLFSLNIRNPEEHRRNAARHAPQFYILSSLQSLTMTYILLNRFVRV